MKIVRAAVVQDSPVVFDQDATLAKTNKLLAEAADKGAHLVLFPEAFVCAYPKGLDFGARVGMRFPYCYVDYELDEWRKRINQSHVLGAKVY